MNLIIFTQTYPSVSSDEQTFIGKELLYLSKRFENIIIVPQNLTQERLPLGKNIQVVKEFSVFYAKEGFWGIIWRSLFSKLLYKEIRQNITVLFSLRKLFRLIKFIGDAEIIRSWTANWIEINKIDIKTSLFYSFWFTQTAMGLGLLKYTYPELKVISRAHGYDIDEERYCPSYLPCRLYLLEMTDRLYLASDHAHRYMLKKHPRFSFLYRTAHLGVEEAGFVNKPSKDNIFRIVSCSSIIPLKRVNLLAQSIGLAARIRPDLEIEWIHFGDGENRQEVEDIIVHFPDNAKGKLKGYLPNELIIEHYRNYPVDVFVNLSTSEGGASIAIQEAISCGIPVIATNVGGNPEIVMDKNGILLAADPTIEQIVDSFWFIVDNPEQTQMKRRGSIEIWREMYDAAKNFDTFAKEISTTL